MENRARDGVCSASCAEIYPRWVGEAPGGRYVGQQHASLTVPMSQFAKSSTGTILLRSIGDIKTSATIIINNGYQFSKIIKWPVNVPAIILSDTNPKFRSGRFDSRKVT